MLTIDVNEHRLSFQKIYWKSRINVIVRVDFVALKLARLSANRLAISSASVNCVVVASADIQSFIHDG